MSQAAAILMSMAMTAWVMAVLCAINALLCKLFKIQKLGAFFEASGKYLIYVCVIAAGLAVVIQIIKGLS